MQPTQLKAWRKAEILIWIRCKKRKEEITMKLEALKIDYQPAIISVEEKENFEKNVLAIAEQYKG